MYTKRWNIFKCMLFSRNRWKNVKRIESNTIFEYIKEGNVIDNSIGMLKLLIKTNDHGRKQQKHKYLQLNNDTYNNRKLIYERKQKLYIIFGFVYLD